MIKTTLKIEGMMCPMCEAHISGAIRRAIPGAKKVSASHTRGEACFLTEEAVEERSEPFEKKGWFGRR